MEPLIYGGASTTIYRSGTPTLALDASLETALSLATEHFEERYARVKELRTILQENLCGYPKVRINSSADAVPHILNLSVAGVRGSVFQKALSDKGIYVSVKSACSVDALPSRAVFAVMDSGIGIAPEDLDFVIMTHLHTDHASGLKSLAAAKKILPPLLKY